jgi:hypothetical protein
MKPFLIVTAVFLTFIPLTAKADALLYGTLNGSGTTEISFGTIDFENNLLSITNGMPNPQVGGFTALAGTSATVQNVVSTSVGGDISVGSLGCNMATPPSCVGIPDFITFAADPSISITATYLYAGIYGSAGCTAFPPAAAQVCTPDVPEISPFNLENFSATTSQAGFHFDGLEVDSTTGDTVPVTGFFTAPFAAQPFQSVLATVLGGGTVSDTFSFQLVAAPIPEPGTLPLLLAGLGLIWSGKSRKRKYSSRDNK